jgi:hypothetical protein
MNLGAAVSKCIVNGLLDIKVSFSASWAGQIPMLHNPNDRLFFCEFEAEALCERLISE